MTQPLTQHEKRLLAALDKAAIEQRDAEQRVYGLARQLRALDIPWETIGRTIGVTKQAAHQRFSA